MAQVWPIIRDHLRQAQQAQPWVYNRGAQLCIFRPGDLVLVLVPTTECKFLAKWQGAYDVVVRVGEVNYSGPLVLAARRDIQGVPVGDDLRPAQKQDLEEVILQHQDVFSEVPRRTTVAQHNIKTAPGVTVHIPPYRVPPWTSSG